MASPSLLALTRALVTDDEAKAAYRDDPEGFLASQGHGDLDPADLATALEHVADALPAPLAAALSTVGDTGIGLTEMLAGVADIDPTEAGAHWAELTATDGIIDGDPFDDLDDAGGPVALGTDPTELDTDPSELDTGPGGFDRVDDPEGESGDEAAAEDGAPGGFDPATPATDDTFGDDTFGDGTLDKDRTGSEIHARADDDPEVTGEPDPSAWEPEELPGGLDQVDDTADALSPDDLPGGFDRADDPD